MKLQHCPEVLCNYQGSLHLTGVEQCAFIELIVAAMREKYLLGDSARNK